MTDKYAVIGDPIKHSLSPVIHADFARQRDEDISYEKINVKLDEFSSRVKELIAAGYKGLNVTVPLKEAAYNFAEKLSDRARTAGAVNTLVCGSDGVYGDNTDGIGLIRDLTKKTRNLNLNPDSILVVGAGGASRGIMQPLLDLGVSKFVVANRTASKAVELCERFSGPKPSSLENIKGKFDLIVNATAAGLTGDALNLPADIIAENCLCYDLVYADRPTPFMEWARNNGANKVSDGLGMLVEQAAESFYVWRGKKVDTAAIYHKLRTNQACG